MWGWFLLLVYLQTSTTRSMALGILQEPQKYPHTNHQKAKLWANPTSWLLPRGSLEHSPTSPSLHSTIPAEPGDPINAICKEPWQESPKCSLNFVWLNVPSSWDVLWPCLVKPHSFVVTEQDKAWSGLRAGAPSPRMKRWFLRRVYGALASPRSPLWKNPGLISRKIPSFCHFTEVLSDL